MPVKIQFEFSVKVTRGLKNKVRKDIINAAQSSPEMIKEMRRVCQMANRRAQNVEKSGYLSPALSTARGKSGYSKFNITGMSWEQQKREYGRAVAYLNQPTSTATGAREFERQLRSGFNMTDEQWQACKHEIMSGYNSTIGGIMSRIPYAEYMQEIYARAESVASRQMENDAVVAVDTLQREINNTAENIAYRTERDIFNGFQM